MAPNLSIVTITDLPFSCGRYSIQYKFPSNDWISLSSMSAFDAVLAVMSDDQVPKGFEIFM